jgi:hypothetical protein
MEYLSRPEFELIIANAMQLMEEEIPFYFINQHSKYIESNLDFIDRLDGCIKLLENQINKEIEYIKTNYNDKYDLNEIRICFDKNHRPMELTFNKLSLSKSSIRININKIGELRKGFEALTHSITNKMTKNTITPNSSISKLKWNGKAAEFGFLIQELIGKGWIEKPSRSLTSDAKLYFNIFEIDTTIQNLANEISTKKNSLTTNNSIMFKIPYMKK